MTSQTYSVRYQQVPWRMCRPLVQEIVPKIQKTRSFKFGVATMLRARRSGVQIPACEIEFCGLQTVQTGSWAHPASYWMGTGVTSPLVKHPGSEGWSIATIYRWGYEWVELYLHSLSLPGTNRGKLYVYVLICLSSTVHWPDPKIYNQ